MQKHLLYINLFAVTSALAFGACADEVENTITSEVVVGEKSPIELAVGGVVSIDQGTVTRASASAVITKEETGMITFPENTNIFMVMQSEYGTEDFKDPSNPHQLKTTVARGTVSKNGNAVSFDDVNKRYWDDAHARSTQLTIWAYAQMYKESWTQCKFQKKIGTGNSWSDFEDAIYNTSTTTYDWSHGEVYPAIKEWNVTHNTDGSHDATSVLCQDLLFSNNIADNRLYPVGTETKIGDKRLKFDFTNRKFPTDNKMYFRHALSKIEIHIKKGVGFGDSFAFTSGTGNVKLSDFNRKGAFNIKEGEFQYIWDHAPIPQIYLHATADAGDAYTLEALAIPNIHQFMKTQKDASDNALSDVNSRFVRDEANTMMEFTIEGNKYEISSKALYNALHVDGNPANALVTNATELTDNGTYIPLEAGKKYVFTFTVGKSKIQNISASVVDWVTVAAAEVPAQIKIETADYAPGTTGTRVNAFDLYVKESGVSNTSYTTDMHSELTTTTSGNYEYSPELYWPTTTKTYYLRGFVDPATGKPSLKSSSDFSAISGTSETEGYSITMNRGNDYQWGTTYNGTNKGAAISPTSGDVHLQFEHVMSQVTVIVKTVDSPDAAKVNLEGSKCIIEGLNKAATINLHTGAVTPITGSGNTSEYTVYDFSSGTGSPVAEGYMQYQIPQAAFAASDGIKFVIKLKDGTVYELPLSDAALTTGSNPITQWEKGKAYKYVLTLKKQEIKVAAQLTDWGTLTTADSEIQL